MPYKLSCLALNNSRESGKSWISARQLFREKSEHVEPASFFNFFYLKKWQTENGVGTLAPPGGVSLGGLINTTLRAHNHTLIKTSRLNGGVLITLTPGTAICDPLF